MERVELQDHIIYVPATIQITGPSLVGKTKLAFELIKYRNDIFSKTFTSIYFCYKQNDEIYQQYEDIVTYHEGVPTQALIESWIDQANGLQILVIFDDLMEYLKDDKLTTALSTRLSHHGGVTCLYISQNIFSQGKSSRTLSLNSHYYFLLNTIRGLDQIYTLARQIYPNKVKGFVDAYIDAVACVGEGTGVPKYLFVGCHPAKSIRDCNLLTNILPIDDRMILYKINSE